MESHHQAATVPIRKSDAVEAGHYSSHYDTHSTNAQASIMPTQPSFSNVKPQDRVSQDDDDEEICPICDFECTCSKGKDDPIEPIPSNANPEQIIESSHALTAIKVPFQPFIGANSAATTDPHSTGHVDIEGRGSYFDAEKRPVAVIVKEETRGNGAGDEFRTSAKNPMAVPTSQRRPSINMRSSGKNIGKYLKSSKSNMSMYHVSNFDSETDKSSEDEDIEGEIGDQIGSRTRYESESDEADDVDDLQSLSSSDDIEAVQERYANQRLGKGNKINLGKKWLKSQSSNSKTKGLEGVKKRGPGRPKKKKDPLIVSPEDEIALYTPAAATRKLTSPQLTGSIIRATNNVKSRAEYPVISYDLDVAEDVMALNASEGSGRDPDEGEAAVNVVLEQIEGELYESLSEADLLGDGDLSDELSGDLSDIMSDDFDGFSEESMDLSSSDEEDETDSSNPREFNYSDMEEQDESLVDSDSSPNSEASDSTDSSDSDSGSDSDEDDIIPYEHEELDESIDEEELQLLEEQERSILSKAHGLLDVFSEEDSDPDRNPFESSDEDEDNDERETDDDDEEVYSDEYYEDEYEEEVYDGMDEQEILARLKGVQSDLQALMMIPAEQQEQLLLLQHYEEAHRQQQEQQVDISGNQFQSTQIQQIGNQHLDPTQRAQLAGLLETPNFLPQFDINVPNLDEVSRQLAASIAESIAQSMAEVNKPGEESSIFPMTALGENISMQLENISGLQDAGIQLNLTSGMSDIPWDTPIPPSPTIPTPTNTPTPPGTSVEISPFAMGSSEFASSQNGQSIISQDSTMDGSGLQQEDMQQQSQNSVQITLSTSKINGESINPTPPQLVPQLKSEVSDTVAQLNIQGNLSECANIDSSQNDSCSLTRVNTGDTTDDDNTPRATQFSDLKKRKGDSLGVSEVGSNEGKRRRLSNTTLKEDTNDGAPLSTPTPESESSSSPNSQAIQLQTELISSFDATSTNSSIDSPSSFSTTPTADMNSSIAYDFSKAGMPFVDPSAKIFDSAPRKHDSVSRLFRNSLKGKESKYHVDLMPMDDLLDTSAFYGRSSSRSPSPNRSGGGEEDNDDEISQSVLKDLNRWQRVPIGTFRKSRRPSSPYVGIKDALKSGNVTMPTTLLEDHQQHQRQLLQESQHRLRRKSSSAKKHRNTSFRVSDLRGQGVISGDPTHHHYQPRSDKVRRRRPIAGDSSHHSNNKLMLKPGESSVNAGLGIGLGNLTGPNISIGLSPITTSSKSRSGSSRRSVVGGDAIDHDTGMHVLKDLMTDSSQLPSSACPTPLHSPLFSATAAGGRVLHHASGEPEGNGIEKMNGLGNNDVESQIEDSIVSHLDLDIGKEMDGFHERLLAKSKALKEEK
ncbi:hypothetical protein BGZ76_001489 [Entomortierella beljakovae]|nr:hypothetical protein BGZ76_001489 [Entomortierella beljakovae]